MDVPSGSSSQASGSASGSSPSVQPAIGTESGTAVEIRFIDTRFQYKPSNSKDPAWRWASAKSKSETSSLFCGLCGRIISSGITRFKEHLLGKAGNVSACPNATEGVKNDIYNHIHGNKKGNKAPLMGMHEVSNPLLEGSPSLASFPSLSRPPLPKGPMDSFARPSHDTLRQTTMENRYKKEERERVCVSICRWFYQNGISFNAVRDPSFQAMIDDISQFGPGLKAPSYHEVRETFLEREVKRVKEFVNGFRKYWAMYGCSIMSDGWTDRKRRTLINFMVHCPQGTIFLKSVDASNDVKDAYKLYTLLKEVILEVGEEHVVQVITDNAANYVAAGRMLMSDFQHLYWTPCAAHCIDLMLEDIGDTTKLKGIFIKARKLVTFLYTHGQVLHMMRKFTNGKDIHRPAVTRFATRFLTFESLWQAKDALRSMTISDEWEKCPLTNAPEGKRSKQTILQERFWKGVSFALRAMSPLVDILRMVDSDEKPAMGYIYEKMDRIKEQIKVNLKEREEQYGFIWEIIDKRWDRQMHRPLHAAALYLNPSLYYEYDRIESNAEIKGGLFQVIDVVVRSSEDKENVTSQLGLYRSASGGFGLDLAIKARKTYAPAEWWVSFGYDCPALQSFAIRVLSLTCSASPCERNWSNFEQIHTKKRNRLLHQKLNDLAFVQYNERLRRRYQQRKATGAGFDPILLYTVEDHDEYPTDDEFVDEDETLTWGDVDLASGASRDKFGCTTRRTRTYKRQRKDKRPIQEDEDDFDFEKETDEDVEDEYDYESD